MFTNCEILNIPILEILNVLSRLKYIRVNKNIVSKAFKRFLHDILPTHKCGGF